MTKLRVAVVGAGHLGRIHTRLLASNDQVELVAVADPSPLAQKQIVDEFNVRTVSDYRKLIGSIDGAVIATPTRMHFDIAQNLLSEKIHTLIEKPLTDSTSDAQELVSLAQRNDCVVQVGHCEQFNPAIKSALDRVGEPKFIQAIRASGYTFRSTDIGVVHDLMIHDIDLVNSMFDGEVIDTKGVGISMFGQNEDIAHARLQFRGGGVANLTASRCSFKAERSFQIFGTNGYASVDLAESKVTCVEIPDWVKNRQYNVLDTTPEQQAFIRDNLFTKILPKEEVEVPRTNAILDEQKNWVQAIKHGGRPRIPVEQGMEAVVIAQSVLDSIATHCWSQSDPQATGPFTMLPGQTAAPATIPFPQMGATSERKAA